MPRQKGSNVKIPVTTATAPRSKVLRAQNRLHVSAAKQDGTPTGLGAGLTGAPGAPGAPGPASSLGDGTAAVGWPEGSSAEPLEGEPGPPGPSGPRGRDAVSVAIEREGAEQLDAIEGEPGPPGPSGPRGRDAFAVVREEFPIDALEPEPGPPGERGPRGLQGWPGPAMFPETPDDRGYEGEGIDPFLPYFFRLDRSEVTTTATGTQADFAPGLRGHSVLRCNNATDLTITGFAGGLPGQTITVASVGAGNVFLGHQVAGSAAANRMINWVTSGNGTPLVAGIGTATYVYDGTTARWRLVAHAMGGTIAVTYAAGNFTASGAMTWTVDAGDQIVLAYTIVGRSMHLSVRLDTTSVGGVADTALRLTIPNACTLGTRSNFIFNGTNAGVIFVGHSDHSAGDTFLSIFTNIGATPWTLAANTTAIFGTWLLNLT